MNVTQKNIAENKKKLPMLKEKVVAAGLLFAMTIAMLVTSTFAWLSLSLNPEVTNINTSVAANGNLEIALAQGTTEEFSAPGESRVGDSILDEMLRNVTWGNLINLSDSRYGLSKLVLRPSLLNDANLIERPLYGPVYDGTGRVVDINTNFGYALWDDRMSRFASSNALGVRAITSMTLGESGAQNIYNAELNLAESANARFQTNYQSMADNEDYMDALASMMTGYMVQNILKVNSSVGGMISDATIKVSDLKQFASMYQTLITCVEEQAGVYANLLNLQASVNQKDLKITAADILLLSYDKTAKTAYNTLISRGYTTYPDNNKTIGIIKDIDSFLYDYNILKSDLVRINNLISTIEGQNRSSISWPNCPTVEGTTTRIIDDIINNLTNVGECTITGGEYKNLKIKSVGATAAMALKDAGVCETKITNGILYNIDNRSGARIRNPEGKPLALSVQVMGTQTIRSNVSTSATDNYFENERTLIAKTVKEKYGAPELIANDSYGYAIDFWVRTNAANSYLTLQGNVLTRTDTIDIKGTDLNGEEVQLYTITVKMNNSESGSGNSLEDMMVISYDVYHSTQIIQGETEEDTQEVECLRFADSHQVVTEESIGDQAIPTPMKKTEDKVTVIGYEGENRVWDGDTNSLLTVSSTTQGSGSCYVFYADTPVDQQRCLELLNSLKVAFVDEHGELLTTAYMDTERHYASAGKVIVPLALDSESINISTDGGTTYAITALEQNVPKRITAIVYLDGTTLTNDKVLSSSDIEGKINIQFGSSQALIPLNNEKLYNSELYAQVQEITPNQFDYDTLAANEKMTSHVKVRVTGTQPKTVTANFIRKINEAQGSPEEEFILTDTDKDGVWEGDYTFLYPGEYILRSVTIDGDERDLKLNEGESYPSVKVKGFSINSVVYSMNDSVMTDADVHSGNVSLVFSVDTPEKRPNSVIGKFMRDDGAAVNVNFAYNPTLNTWQGSANFVSSGVYTMQYVVIDDQYVELAAEMQKTVDLTLGMRVDVQTTSPTTVFFGDASAPESLQVQVKIVDNSGEIVPNLAGVSMVYSMTGTETLYAQLSYNSGAQQYEGEFPVEAGTWSFKRVSIRTAADQENHLFKVNSDAPVFTVVPPTPPSFVDNSAEAVQYVNANGSATMTVSLRESGSARVYAKLVNADDATDVVYVIGTHASSVNDIFNYIFNIPDGLWNLESVSAFGVFDENQTYHPIPETVDSTNYDSGIVFDASNTSGAFKTAQIAVLNESNITVNFDFSKASNVVDSTNKAVKFGKDANGNTTAEFMQTHTPANDSISVTVNDKNNLIGRGYFTISNVSLGYKYGNDKDSNGNYYGGYSSSSYESLNGTSVGVLRFVHDSGVKHTLKNDGASAVSFKYATQYLPDTVNYTVTSSQNGEVNNNVTVASTGAYRIEVYSKAPSVVISDISMDDLGTYSVDTNTSGGVADTRESSAHREVGNGCSPDQYYKVYINDQHIHSNENTQYFSKIVDANGNKVTQGLSAYLYFKCNHTGPVASAAQYGCDYEAVKTNALSSISGMKPHFYGDANGSTVPSATLSLSGLGPNATKAELNFVNTSASDTAVRLYTTYTKRNSSGNTSGLVSGFEWTNGATTCKRYVGELIEGAGSNGGDTKTATGTIKATTLTVTHDGKTYDFQIPEITINNPF